MIHWGEKKTITAENLKWFCETWMLGGTFTSVNFPKSQRSKAASYWIGEREIQGFSSLWKFWSLPSGDIKFGNPSSVCCSNSFPAVWSVLRIKSQGSGLSVLSGKFPCSEVSSLENIWSWFLVGQDTQPRAPQSWRILAVVDDLLEHVLAPHAACRRAACAHHSDYLNIYVWEDGWVFL